MSPDRSHSVTTGRATLGAALRLGLGATTLLLVGFHAVLFADQVARGVVVEPDRALRWLTAGGLVALLAALKGRGGSLTSRQAVAVWALAALLHGPALSSTLGASGALPALPEAVVTVLQCGVAGAAVSLWLTLGTLGGAAPGRRRPGVLRLAQPPLARVESSILSPSFAPRPPPLAATRS